MQETVQIYRLLAMELKAYPASQVTPEGLKLIAERLDKRFSFSQVERAMGQLAYKSKFFPSLAEIAEAVESSETTEELIARQERQRQKRLARERAYMKRLEEAERDAESAGDGKHRSRERGA